MAQSFQLILTRLISEVIVAGKAANLFGGDRKIDF